MNLSMSIGRSVSLILLLLIATTSGTTTANPNACRNDPYSLNNFESNYSMWAINVKNLTLRINLGASKSCLNSAFLTFDAFFSGPNQTPFGFVSISSTQCIANVTNNQRHTYGDLSMSCNQHSNGTNSQVEVSITLENQNSALNSTYVRLELRPTASRDALSVQSQTIIFKNCSQNESGLSFTTADNPSNHFAYGDNARYACHSPHGIIFVKPPGQSEYIETNAGSATCGSRATWEFNNPTKCWNGRVIDFDKHKPDHAVHVYAHPVLFICRSPNATFSRVQLKIGQNSIAEADNAVWENITNRDLPSLPDIIQIECVHKSKQGNESYVQKLKIQHKRIHDIHKEPVRYAVNLNSGAVIRIPVHSSKIHLTRRDVHVKRGEDEPFKTYRIGGNATHPFVELDFINITQADLGLYDIRISRSRTDVFSFKIELINRRLSAGLSPGAKAGVAVTVVISILLIAISVGYVVRKFVKHKRELDKDGQRVLIIDDNNDNDDVFHDPTRAARFQEELMRDREDAPADQTADDSPTQERLVVNQNNYDKLSAASEHSETFILANKVETNPPTA